MGTFSRGFHLLSRGSKTYSSNEFVKTHKAPVNNATETTSWNEDAFKVHLNKMLVQI